MLDYIVTLAVQASAGVLAIISTFPNLAPYKVEMVLFVIAFLTYGNLRGVKEAGKAFAAPTYLFILGMYVVFVVGIYRVFNGSLEKLSTGQEGANHGGQHHHDPAIKTVGAVNFFVLTEIHNAQTCDDGQ